MHFSKNTFILKVYRSSFKLQNQGLIDQDDRVYTRCNFICNRYINSEQSRTMNIVPKQLLNQLVKNKDLTQEQADKFELESLKKNASIYDYLVNETNIDKKVILNAIATVSNIPFIDLLSSPIDPQAIGFISESIARSFSVIPYRYDNATETIFLGTNDPFNTTIIDFLSKKTNKKISLVLADSNDIAKAIDLSYSQGITPEVRDALKEYHPLNQQKQGDLIGSVIKEAPIAKIVTTILEFALKSRASDIHIEALELKTKVRYRIDGILHEKLSLPKSIHEALVSRIKILSEMKIDEKRIPQDGRFTFKLGEDEVDLRVSTLPTVNGEKVVMRLLKKTGGVPSVMDLGLRGPQYKDLEEAITKPYGIILVTGPTGSGKTTTLYAVLSRLNKPSVNIVTLEDPVEYQMPGINQVQINPQAGLTFATGLRSFLRQDPNIILVGEIRDSETTQLAIQAALTGHLVFSTLHTNDASTAIPRLIDLGAEPFLIASVINASLAQRICRRICTFCKVSYEPTPQVQQNIKEVLGDLLPKPYKEGKSMLVYKGNGCNECNQTGYIGRIAIFEVLKVTSTINRMILQQSAAKDIEAQARKDGLIIMKQDGYLKALDGITTIEEVLRVAEV
ncbi:MAG: General secretory pathway protein E [Candidatus Roizmanbacteria bacterium GW2011_GWA2_36_23]|uniref:General secretory pathway protein E n=1 Tax=Candidatus Roizmanbacteria bacterium GW2011_GWA2_36_23 TaxID=1618480 RepID=A0A0G0EJX3_9BACT|nr:MAG: General secretory pathway protein E [Candidatus Roizmanbacteria bacterium GW2011_GWA2_36_23]